jgi:hypothetical protein
VSLPEGDEEPGMNRSHTTVLRRREHPSNPFNAIEFDKGMVLGIEDFVECYTSIILVWLSMPLWNRCKRFFGLLSPSGIYMFSIIIVTSASKYLKFVIVRLDRTIQNALKGWIPPASYGRSRRGMAMPSAFICLFAEAIN